MKPFAIVFFMLSILVFASCGKTGENKYSVKMISCETDIEGLSAEIKEGEQSFLLNIMLYQEQYEDCYLSNYVTIVSDEGKEVQTKDGYGTEDSLIRFEKTDDGKGRAEKIINLGAFNFPGNGEYIFQNEIFTDSPKQPNKLNLQHLGTIDLRLSIQIN